MSTHSIILNAHFFILQASGGYGYDGRNSFTIGSWILIIVLLWLLFAIIAGLGNRARVVPTAHWYHHFDNLQMPVKDFYSTMESGIKELQMPGLGLSRITYLESSLLNARREYLRVSRGELVFDICAAPFGKGYFISWWEGEVPNFLQILIYYIPFIGKRLESSLFKKTYYQQDTEKMFQESIHKILLSAVDTIASEKGIRGPVELQRIPVVVNR